MIISEHLIQYTGKIVFEPENVTKKHLGQSNWKRVAMVLFEDDIADYYAWFLRKKYNLILNKPIRGGHVSFINDSLNDFKIANSDEEKEIIWKTVKQKWDGELINVVLNINNINSDGLHWWLMVDQNYRHELHAIRAELGLDRPFFGLHMTIGYVNERNLDHSTYLNSLNKKGFIEFHD